MSKPPCVRSLPRWLLPATVMLAAAAWPGCGHEWDAAPEDGDDSWPDADALGDEDTGPDADADGDEDTGPDADADGEEDGDDGLDEAADAETDSPAEAEAEAGADGDEDAGPDADADGEDDGDDGRDDAADAEADSPDEADSPAEAEAEADADGDGDSDVAGPNTGAACETADDCSGPLAQCMTEITGVPPIGTITLPGGYCSSACAVGSDDCGPTGWCLDGTSYGMDFHGCVKSCTTATEEIDCRIAEGYTCNTFMIFDYFCAPPITP